MSLLSVFLQGAGTLSRQAAVQRVLGALTSIALTRGLGPTDFGAYSAVVNTASSAYGVFRIGIDSAIHVYAARGRENAAASPSTGELLGAGLALLATAGIMAAATLAILAEWVATAVFDRPELITPLRYAGILTALQCFSQLVSPFLSDFRSSRSMPAS